ECLLQPQRSRRYVMRVARNEVHRAVRQPALGTFLRRLPESAEQRLRSHLYVATLRQPFEEPLRLRANQRVPFRMRNNGKQSPELQVVQRLVQRRWNRKIRELHQ